MLKRSSAQNCSYNQKPQDYCGGYPACRYTTQHHEACIDHIPNYTGGTGRIPTGAGSYVPGTGSVWSTIWSMVVFLKVQRDSYLTCEIDFFHRNSSCKVVCEVDMFIIL